MPGVALWSFPTQPPRRADSAPDTPGVKIKSQTLICRCPSASCALTARDRLPLWLSASQAWSALI